MSRASSRMVWSRCLVAVGALSSSVAHAQYNPPESIPPNPDFTSACSGTSYDNSEGCANAVLQAIANARVPENLPPMVLPSNWYALTPTQQLFVATNLEIVARSLPAMEGMATALDTDAQGAAVQDGDPSSVPNSISWTGWGGNWAGGDGSPLAALYYWMYDDGLGSDNEDCTLADQSGCWGHRDNIIGTYQCGPCLMGVGFAYDFSPNLPDWTEILVGATATAPLDLAWSQVTPFLDGGAATEVDAGSPTSSTASTTSTTASSAASTAGAATTSSGASTASTTMTTSTSTNGGGTGGATTTSTGGSGSTGTPLSIFASSTSGSSSIHNTGGCSTADTGDGGFLCGALLLSLTAGRRRVDR